MCLTLNRCLNPVRGGVLKAEHTLNCFAEPQPYFLPTISIFFCLCGKKACIGYEPKDNFNPSASCFQTHSSFLCPNLLISVAENYVSECLPGLKRMLFKKCG